MKLSLDLLAWLNLILLGSHLIAALPQDNDVRDVATSQLRERHGEATDELPIDMVSPRSDQSIESIKRAPPFNPNNYDYVRPLGDGIHHIAINWGPTVAPIVLNQMMISMRSALALRAHSAGPGSYIPDGALNLNYVARFLVLGNDVNQISMFMTSYTSILRYRVAVAIMSHLRTCFDHDGTQSLLSQFVCYRILPSGRYDAAVHGFFYESGPDSDMGKAGPITSLNGTTNATINGISDLSKDSKIGNISLPRSTEGQNTKRHIMTRRTLSSLDDALKSKGSPNVLDKNEKVHVPAREDSYDELSLRDEHVEDSIDHLSVSRRSTRLLNFTSGGNLNISKESGESNFVDSLGVPFDPRNYDTQFRLGLGNFWVAVKFGEQIASWILDDVNQGLMNIFRTLEHAAGHPYVQVPNGQLSVFYDWSYPPEGYFGLFRWQVTQSAYWVLTWNRAQYLLRDLLRMCHNGNHFNLIQEFVIYENQGVRFAPRIRGLFQVQQLAGTQLGNLSFAANASGITQGAVTSLKGPSSVFNITTKGEDSPGNVPTS